MMLHLILVDGLHRGSSLGVQMKTKYYPQKKKDGDKIQAILDVQLKDVLVVRRGFGKNKKDAKAHVSSVLLKGP